MKKKNNTYILLYKYSDQFNIDIEFLKNNDIDIKYADSEDEALDIGREYPIGVFLAVYDSHDESSIYVLRKMMQQFPYIQRFLLTTQINNNMLERAVNKAHINYFLQYPIDKDKLLVFINKAFRRYQDVIRPYDKLDKLADLTVELVEDIEKYQDEATKDALTGLLNRRSFDSILNRFSNLYKKKKIPFVLALLDLDKFKKINDSYGHSAGDIVLRKFGATMLSCSRLGEDFTFRYGGEEFAMLSHGNSEIEMEIYLNRLLTTVRKMQISYKDFSIRFSFSAGIAVMKDTLSPEQIIQNADAALYYAKDHGRNQITNYAGIKNITK